MTKRKKKPSAIGVGPALAGMSGGYEVPSVFLKDLLAMRDIME